MSTGKGPLRPFSHEQRHRPSDACEWLGGPKLAARQDVQHPAPQVRPPQRLVRFGGEARARGRKRTGIWREPKVTDGGPRPRPHPAAWGTPDSRAVSAAPANGRHDSPKTRVSSRKPEPACFRPGARKQASSAMAYLCSPLLFAPGRLER